MKSGSIKLAALLICMCMIFCACKSTDVDTTEDLTTSPVTTIATAEPTTEAPKVLNPLTGESGFNEDAVGKRPVAIMINNVFAALPQYGIAEADIMYETLVEGGITRMMALYADYTEIDKVLSIRSSRYYYPLLANGHDAIYIHWGGDHTTAYPLMEDLGLDRLDGYSASKGASYFERDTSLGRSSEHTGYITGENIAAAIDELGYRTELKSEKNKPAFVFNDEEKAQAAGTEACTTLNVDFSYSYYSTFTYDEAEGVYYKQHSGSPHMDALTDTQLSFTNVLVLESNIYTLLPDGTEKQQQLRAVDLDGGSGYYISKGTYTKINWEKGEAEDSLVITDENGDPQAINAGKTFICITDTETNVEIN